MYVCMAILYRIELEFIVLNKIPLLLFLSLLFMIPDPSVLAHAQGGKEGPSGGYAFI